MSSFSVLAEQQVIGAILLDASTIGVVRERLCPDDFYAQVNREIFSAMCDLDDKGKCITTVSIYSLLVTNKSFEEAGGISYLMQCEQQLPCAAAVETHAGLVLKDSKRRKLVQFAQKCKSLCDKPIDDVDSVITNLSDELLELTADSLQQPWINISDGVKKAISSLLNEEQEQFIKTGFIDLDAKITGLRPGTLTIIAARPAMGKTALALNIMSNVALRSSRHVGFFSLEMTGVELITRLICSEAKVNGNAIQQKKMTEEEWTRVLDSAEVIDRSGIHINETPGVDISLLRELSRRMKRRHNIGLLIVDYLQLITVNHKRVQTREQEVSNISRGLKLIAKELNIPVIAMSQLNRGLDARADKRPILSDLRESGSIEQDADNVIFIHREDYYNGEAEKSNTAEIIIAKQRNGPTGSVKLHWDGDITRFDNLMLGDWE